MALLSGSPQASALVSPLFTPVRHTVRGNTDVRTRFYNVHTNKEHQLLRAQQVYLSLRSHILQLDTNFPGIFKTMFRLVCITHVREGGFTVGLFSHQNLHEPWKHFLTHPCLTDETLSL